MQGKLIIIEGIDNTGKSTTCQHLESRLAQMGNKAIFIKTPRPEFVDITQYMNANANTDAHFLFHLSMVKFIEPMIREYVNKKYIVICDRYFYSTFAYHIGVNVNIEFNSLFSITPDYLFMLETEEGERMRRAKEKIIVNSHDLESKQENPIFIQIEENLRSYNPMIINNTSLTEEETASAIIQLLSSHVNDQF